MVVWVDSCKQKYKVKNSLWLSNWVTIPTSKIRSVHVRYWWYDIVGNSDQMISNNGAVPVVAVFFYSKLKVLIDLYFVHNQVVFIDWFCWFIEKLILPRTCYSTNALLIVTNGTSIVWVLSYVAYWCCTFQVSCCVIFVTAED